jgi:ABC-2 type transport system ATP-binding protein
MTKPTRAPKQAATADVVLQTNDLHKKFISKGPLSTHALRGVSLQALKGQVTGLVGVDGAGKSTLIRMAAGLLRPTSGSLKVLGFDPVTQALKIQSAIGYMPQKFGLYQDLSVTENLNLYADLQGVPTQTRTERFSRLLEMTKLASYRSRRAGKLSGGMKQKLGLACALIKSPALLLLDEPTVGVDPVSRRELWRIVYELVKQENIGVFVATAYMDEAERCDLVIALHQGAIHAQGAPHDISKQLRNPVYIVTPDSTTSIRQIYIELATRADIVDTSIRAGNVRIVGTPELKKKDLDLINTSIQAVPACFEDAFTALIPAKRHDFQPKQFPKPIEAAKNTPENIIETQNLRKNFGTFTAVNDLSFCVQRGEIFGLLGPNGAGKSTSFRMLCGLLPASAGKISVAGYNLHRSRAKARARLGYMSQQFSLYGQLSVSENLNFFGKAYGLGNKKRQQRIDWAYSEFGLGDKRNSPAALLPGGYKQRLSMAAALLHEPDILFLDEPTSGVDLFARREFWLRINNFAEQGVTIVVTTHFMEEAEYCDRMLIMSQGETLAIGTPTQIRALAQTTTNPQPSMDDAFIALAQSATKPLKRLDGRKEDR